MRELLAKLDLSFIMSNVHERFNNIRLQVCRTGSSSTQGTVPSVSCRGSVVLFTEERDHLHTRF